MVPESTCNIRNGFVLEGSIRGRLIKSVTSSSKITGTVFYTKHITYIIRIAFNNKSVRASTRRFCSIIFKLYFDKMSSYVIDFDNLRRVLST